LKAVPLQPLKIKDNSPQFLWSGTPRVLLSEMWDVHCDRTAANAFSRNLRQSDYVIQTRPQQRLELRRQQSDDATKARTRERTIMEMPAKQAPTASSGTARERAGAARGHRHGSLDTK